METIELEKTKSIQNGYLDASKYDKYFAINEALEETDIGPFDSTEEMFKHIYDTWDED